MMNMAQIKKGTLVLMWRLGSDFLSKIGIAHTAFSVNIVDVH
jgi:hypothetical protein